MLLLIPGLPKILFGVQEENVFSSFCNHRLHRFSHELSFTRKVFHYFWYRRNIPEDVVPVRSNCGLPLKVPRDKDGVADVKTLYNSPEEHPLFEMREQDL